MKISGIVVLAFCLMVSAIILAVGYSNYDPTMKEVASWKSYRDGLIQEYKNAPKSDPAGKGRRKEGPGNGKRMECDCDHSYLAGLSRAGRNRFEHERVSACDRGPYLQE